MIYFKFIFEVAFFDKFRNIYCLSLFIDSLVAYIRKEATKVFFIVCTLKLHGSGCILLSVLDLNDIFQRKKNL